MYFLRAKTISVLQYQLTFGLSTTSKSIQLTYDLMSIVKQIALKSQIVCVPEAGDRIWNVTIKKLLVILVAACTLRNYLSDAA